MSAGTKPAHDSRRQRLADLQDRYTKASEQFKITRDHDERRKLLRVMGEVMVQVEKLASELREEFDEFKAKLAAKR
jgi:hemerythrin-like domain-containing protein